MSAFDILPEGTRRLRPYTTPRAVLDLQGDLRECYRALNRVATDARMCSGLGLIRSRALACQMGWRYARAELALSQLERLGWVASRVIEGVRLWTVKHAFR